MNLGSGTTVGSYEGPGPRWAQNRQRAEYALRNSEEQEEFDLIGT